MSGTRFDTGATGARAMRGQPVIFLSVVALVWIFGRVIAHLPGIDASDISPLPGPYAEVQEAERVAPDIMPETEAAAPARIAKWSFVSVPVRTQPRGGNALSRNGLPLESDVMAAHQLLLMDQMMRGTGTAAPVNIASLQPTQRQDLWDHLAATRFVVPAVDYRGNGKARLNRWSVQGWGYVRGGGSGTLAVGQGQYGGSQIGLIGRYALNPEDGRRLELYLRFAGALPGGERSGFDDAELALGLSGRPFRSLPVALAIEQRVGIGGSAGNRQAAYAVTQLPPIGLPLGGDGSVYAQTGIVGIKKPQVFFDLQMLAEHPVARAGKVELSAGAGLWSGGQTARDNTERDIYRIDVGPRASARVPIGEGGARLSLDYRARIAGNADPGSGLALTLSTDF